MIAEILVLVIACAASSYVTSNIVGNRWRKHFNALRKEARAKLQASAERLDGSVHQVHLLKSEVELLRGRVGLHRTIWSDASAPKGLRKEPLEVSGFALTQPFEEFAATVLETHHEPQ